MQTPWGESQTIEVKPGGVLVVGTAGHGGVYVPPKMLRRIPLVERAYAATWSGSERWYEEDCAAAIPIYRLRECFPNVTDEQARCRHDRVRQYWGG